jgi:diacylglycerol kinase family enzyme
MRDDGTDSPVPAGPAVTATSQSSAPVASGRARGLAGLALVSGLAAVAVPLAAAGVRGSIALLLVGAAGLLTVPMATWWFLTHRGVLRVLAAVLVLAVPLVVMGLYIRAGLLWAVVLTAILWAAAVVVGRAAVADPDAVAGPTEREVPAPRHPFLIMNPWSGGGKVARFDLVGRARELGAQVALMEGPEVDVAALARSAVAAGADLLAVAGGDGTQALVAGIAADHDLPFMVISAGTRNHFALDLGLDRDDPASGLDALRDGVEVSVDLGSVAGRTFVNNASFGAYAGVVQSPAYRAGKTRTTLDLLPTLLARHATPVLRVQAGRVRLSGPQALLVSNNSYVTDDIVGLGRRPRLDEGVLGVIAVTVETAADAARLARGAGAGSVWQSTCNEVLVDADEVDALPVGVDGEALVLPTPIRCVIRPAALRVRVPRHRPGVPPVRRHLSWTQVARIALSGRRV